MLSWRLNCQLGRMLFSHVPPSQPALRCIFLSVYLLPNHRLASPTIRALCSSTILRELPTLSNYGNLCNLRSRGERFFGDSEVQAEIKVYLQQDFVPQRINIFYIQPQLTNWNIDYCALSLSCFGTYNNQAIFFRVCCCLEDNSPSVWHSQMIFRKRLTRILIRQAKFYFLLEANSSVRSLVCKSVIDSLFTSIPHHFVLKRVYFRSFYYFCYFIYFDYGFFCFDQT